MLGDQPVEQLLALYHRHWLCEGIIRESPERHGSQVILLPRESNDNLVRADLLYSSQDSQSITSVGQPLFRHSLNVEDYDVEVTRLKPAQAIDIDIGPPVDGVSHRLEIFSWEVVLIVIDNNNLDSLPQLLSRKGRFEFHDPGSWHDCFDDSSHVSPQFA